MNKKILIGAIIAAIGIPAFVYAAGPLFINTTIDEPLPTNTLVQKQTMEEKTMPEKEAMMKKSETMTQEESMMEKGETMEEKTMVEKESMTEKQVMEEKMEVMEKETKTESQIMTMSGTFVGVGDGIHDAQGSALVIPLDSGQSILRLEDFRSTNGPDLYVYLATDSGATDYVSLGRLKANIGNQNYDIPEGTDLSKYDTVLIWCKQFSVLFGSAELA
jgi:hypothetical protein